MTAQCAPFCVRSPGETISYAPSIAVLACADYFHEDVRGASCRAIAQLGGACAAAEIAPIDQGAWVRGGVG